MWRSHDAAMSSLFIAPLLSLSAVRPQSDERKSFFFSPFLTSAVEQRTEYRRLMRKTWTKKEGDAWLRRFYLVIVMAAESD